jgi:hypothetical protein
VVPAVSEEQVVNTNVKPGDIAMVKAPYVEQGRGAIVVVERLAGIREELSGCVYVWQSEYGHGWVVRGWVKARSGFRQGPQLVISDQCLRPLRDTDGEDEVLRLAGKPKSAEYLAVRISTLREEFDEACRKAVQE